MNEDLSLLGPPAILVGILNGVGAWLKSIPKFPNNLIPVVLPVAGAIIYPFVFRMPDTGDAFLAGPDVTTFVKACYGFGIGLSAVGTHQAFTRIKSDSSVDTKPQTPIENETH